MGVGLVRKEVEVVEVGDGSVGFGVEDGGSVKAGR